MTLDLTSRQMDSGEADSAEPFPMYEFSTPMLNPALKLSDAYKYHESVKTLKYQRRILDMEHSSFVPLIFA